MYDIKTYLHGWGAQSHESIIRRADIALSTIAVVLAVSSSSSFWHGVQLHPCCGPQIPSQHKQDNTLIPQ